MSTIRIQIRDAAMTALSTMAPIGIPVITKRRYIPGERVTADRIAVFFGEEEARNPGGRAGPIKQRSLVLAVQAIVAVDEPEEADDAMEPLLARIVERLGNTNLDALATDLTELGTLWASGQGGKFILAALMRWRVEYQTKRGDLDARQ